jgi:PAS domain S-box-containing protein
MKRSSQIEQLRELEEKLRDAEPGRSLWAGLADVIADAMFVMDEDRRIIYWSRRAEEMTGFTTADVLGKNCCADERCNNCLKGCQLFQEGEMSRHEGIFATKDGRVIPVLKNGLLFRNSSGKILGAVETIRDISVEEQTSQKLAREQVRFDSQKRLLESVISTVAEGAVAIDCDLQIVSFSRQASEITGVAVEDAIGAKCCDVLKNPLCEEQCPMQHLTEHRNKQPGLPTRISGAGGDSIPVTESVVPIFLEGRLNGGIIILRDMRAEEKLALEQMRSGQLDEMIGRSGGMQNIFYLIDRLADLDTPACLVGEQGTGRDIVARTLHRKSVRAEAPLRSIDCGLLPEHLLESEFFGHLKGAMPGAVRDKVGQLELAHRGTLYVAQAEKLPRPLQEKLVGFLESGEFHKVGGQTTISSDVRLICAFNEDVRSLADEGRFSPELLGALGEIVIDIPPLRDRRLDIELLVAHFLKSQEVSGMGEAPTKKISAGALRALVRYPWPGNVLELRNVLDYAVSVCSGATINLNDLPPEIISSLVPSDDSGEDDERTRILRALEETHWRRSEAAQALGMDRSTLWRKMKSFGLC